MGLEKKTVLSNQDLNLLKQVRRIHSNPIITATIATKSNYMPKKGEVILPTGEPVTEQMKHELYGFKLSEDLSPGPNSVKFYVPEPYQDFKLPETVQNPQSTKKSPKQLSGFAKAILNPKTMLLGTLALVAAGESCKSPAGPEDPPPEPIPVEIIATFFNHTQGPITEKTYNGMSGNPLTIRISDITAIDTDPQRIAVREAGNSTGLGRLIGFSTNGEINTDYPRQSMYYDVFLMNTNAGANYQLIDKWANQRGGILAYSPHAEWKREDIEGVTGPEGSITTVMNDLNKALNYSWGNSQRKYGSFTKVTGSADFGVGYNNSGPWHSSTLEWAGVPHDTPTEFARITGFNEEVFELITRTDDINGSSTLAVICDIDGDGRLNLVGRDLLAYVYVKDNKIF